MHSSSALEATSTVPVLLASSAGRNGHLATPRRLWSPVAREYAEVLVAISAVTLGGWFVPLTYRSLGHVYLLTVIAVSLRVGRWPALFAALISTVAWDFVFVPPRLSFSILHFDDLLLFGSYCVVALVGSQLTSRAHAQQQAEHERQRLAESERLHRTLLDSVSHELKTPLSVLRSASEKLGTNDPAKRAGLAIEICTATRRLDHLVANLLNQTRLDAGVVHARPDWCDARDIITGARRAVSHALAAHRLTLEIPSDLPLFWADAGLLEQAIANLILNAARHTPAGSAVWVRAGTDRDRIFIAVADNGPGLPPEIAADPFQKFRPGRQAGPGGLGLGLSIVRGFAAAQGGEVTAAVRPGGGTVFTVFLPYVSHGIVPDDER